MHATTSGTSTPSSAPTGPPGYSGPLDQQNRPHGYGTQRYGDGSRYEGEFVHGLIHGKGVFRHQTGATYVGQFDKGKRGPRGTYTFACGTQYDGDYSNDKRVGKGVMTFSRTAGSAIRNSRTGEAIPSVVLNQTSVARKYVGSFIDGKMHGSGTLSFADSGAEYTGAFAADLEHGRGVLVFNHGRTRLEGSFKGGAPTALCTVIHTQSGERSSLLFGATGKIEKQICVAEAAAKRPCPPFTEDDLERPDASADKCPSCSALRRLAGDLATWLEPPEAISASRREERQRRRRAAEEAAAAAKANAEAEAAAAAKEAADAAAREAAEEQERQRRAEEEEAAAAAPKQQPTPAKRPLSAAPKRPGSAARSRDAAAKPVVFDDSASSSAASSMERTPVEVRLRALEEAIERRLREAHAGLGFAIADCVSHDNSGVEETAASPVPASSSTVDTCTTRVRVVQVAPGTPANHAGFARGDFVLAVDGVELQRAATFTSMALVAGQRVRLTMQRRRPGAHAAATPNVTPGKTQRGERFTVGLIVGSSLEAEEAGALAGLRDHVARALAGTEELDAAAIDQWREAVDAIPVRKFPVPWPADDEG